jgi:hypothetical protein
VHKGRMELVGWRSTHQREARRTGGEGGKQSCVAPVAMDEPMMGGWDPGVRWDQGVTPAFPKKTKCITICMSGSSFMHIVTYKWIQK